MNKLLSRPKAGFMFDRTRRNSALLLIWAVLFLAVYIVYMVSAIGGGENAVSIIIFSIIFPLFFVYALLTILFPRLHPNYLILSRLGDTDKISAQLDAELDADDVLVDGRSTLTEHFEVVCTLHATVVRKR